MEHPQPPKHRPAEPLLTRHVFLDTQVYRALHHNPDNPALLALKEHIKAHRVILHTVDITLLEVKRQLLEAAQARAREMGEVEKDFRRWRKQAPKSMPKRMPEFDAAALGDELFGHFHSFIAYQCDAVVHKALSTVSAEVVFATYFDRRPPFDGQDSKEFPDGFVIAALSKWAETTGDKIHVVTADGAMARAAKADPNLLPMKSLHEVLARAAADLGPEAEAIADALLNGPAFDSTFERLLQAQMKDVVYVYTGDLAEGEAYEGELISIEEVGDWSVAGLSDKRVSLILDAKIKVLVEVQYEDRDSAMYDREDDRWVGAEDAATQVEDNADIEVLVEIDRASGEVVGGKVLTSEIEVSGPHDYDY